MNKESKMNCGIKFKIDLIVWKYCSYENSNDTYVTFKIDLIVWKSICHFRKGRRYTSLK